MTTREGEQQDEGISMTLGALATVRGAGAHVGHFPAELG